MTFQPGAEGGKEDSQADFWGKTEATGSPVTLRKGVPGGFRSLQWLEQNEKEEEELEMRCGGTLRTTGP